MLEEEPEVETRTVQEDPAYASEYGLSDGAKQGESDADQEDLPQAPGENASQDAPGEHGSEHNPDDLDPDES
jgi:hypothetical protein